MKARKIALAIAPAILMAGLCLALTGAESWLARFGTTPGGKMLLGRIGLALPYAVPAALGVIAVSREIARLHSLANAVPAGEHVLAYADLSTVGGATIAALVAVFGLRVAMRGNAAFAAAVPRRIRGRRAIHGESDWMTMTEAVRQFPDAGGMVIGERYRVDKDAVADQAFRAGEAENWGAGGRKSLL
jgi:type IV secretion system protein VirD4